ncbi:hypothetical membrane protein [Thermoplasma acidophilum]|uniref:Hypothetical membrane protein n=1 Tax=Thermoplasma acidophilum (strain ATCC 25905 / DSM 1728 / JCM 9062 / NBRC 15155 / AMRC-C165) TaxID=273075 RepID=Q9HKT5_THEAC|nr:hypothetical protein [Thermoplasma acidophilum]MCY0852393.1 hypothetical protein [Thermoplasma acidophilum]CAC11650.1 hypothetical membrane protein [Thermoplasma acidophilum]
MNYKRLIPLIAVALLLPTVATASVIVSDSFNVSVSSTTTGLYLSPGPNYATAHSSGYIYAPAVGTGNSENITSGSEIMVNYTEYSGTDYLMNVLEIKDVGFSGVLYLNGSLPAGVSIYVSNNSQSKLVWDSSYDSYLVENGTQPTVESNYNLDSAITLTAGHIYYISFVISVSGSSSVLSGPSTIYLNYVSD